jgi:nucleoside-diphosphate-sugar epimerase
VSVTPRSGVEEDCAAAATPAVVEALAPLRDDVLVVTGGTGFAGTWIAELVSHLNDHHGFGTRLVLLARRSDRQRAAAPRLAERPDVHVVERDAADISELPADTGWIVHAAGSPDNRLHAFDPVGTWRGLVSGTDAVLRVAGRLERLQRFVHVSSGLVYGAQPLDLERAGEGHRGTAAFGAPGDVYADAKRAAETLCAVHRSQYRIPVVTVRPFAFLGAHQPLTAPWAINNFMQDALNGGPIRILGNGSSTRSYLYASDLAVWLLTALVRGTPGRAYNVGSERALTLRELAERVARGAGGGIEVVEAAPGRRATEPSRFVPDTSAARTELGVGETVGLDAAIVRTLAWHRAAGPATAPTI